RGGAPAADRRADVPARAGGGGAPPHAGAIEHRQGDTDDMRRPRKRTSMLASLAVVALGAAGAAQPTTAPSKPAPTVDQILSLKRVASPEISPDGRRVAYTVREKNWDD